MINRCHIYMYCIKISLCVSLTQVEEDMSPKISKDSKAMEEKPTETAAHPGAAHPPDSVAASS